MNNTKKTVNLALQVVPLNSETPYKIIDNAIDVIKKSNVNYMVSPFATSMEGGLDELLKIVLECKDACFEKGADELLLNLQIHIRKNDNVSFDEKLNKY